MYSRSRVRAVRLIAALCIVFVSTGTNAASVAVSEWQSAFAARPDAVNGGKLFQICVVCHGGDAAGNPNGSVPAIAGQHYQVIIKQIVDFRHARRWDLRMERFVDEHNLRRPQDVADVADFVAHVPRAWPVTIGSGEFLPAGTDAYIARCASCHGASGVGSNTNRIPRIAGQHQQYLVRQMQDAADGRRPNMSAAHIVTLRRMTYAEIQGIADYLSRIPPQH